jgi:tripartite-type tricarboxylate transporter receptor subunit TctC
MLQSKKQERTIRMKRQWIATALCAFAMVSAGAAQAQTSYPARPVRLVVPATAGDGSDVLARTLARALAESLNQQFVIENRPGAGGSIGADAVAKSAPDRCPRCRPWPNPALPATRRSRGSACWRRSRRPPRSSQDCTAKCRRPRARPDVRETLARSGSEASGIGPAEFSSFIRSEIAKYSKVIRDAGIKVE